MRMASKDKRQTHKNKNFLASFEFAVTGLQTVFIEERNMRKHVTLGTIAVIFGFLFHLQLMEWLWLLLAIFLVLIVETINTIFENLVDLVTDRHFHEIAKKVKDMAAGAVLIAAVFAVIVGAILFLPKLYQLLLVVIE